MARPKKDITRSRRLIVRLTDEEHSRVVANARDAQLRVSAYVRRASLDGYVRPSGYAVVLAEQIRRVGVNLNQLMPIAHRTGQLPRELALVLSQIEGLLDQISDTF